MLSMFVTYLQQGARRISLLRFKPDPRLDELVGICNEINKGNEAILTRAPEELKDGFDCESYVRRAPVFFRVHRDELLAYLRPYCGTIRNHMRTELDRERWDALSFLIAPPKRTETT